MDTPQTSAQMIGTILSGRYRLEAKIGSGGMSTVYLARDETLDRAVALKVMHREMSEQPDQLQRFRQEARSVAKLSHQNIVGVIDAGEDGGHPYIVFEYIEGETLKQRIARLGALEVQEAVAYTIELARGLAIAHSRQMVHRDVKPQNVLIDANGRAKLTDFGISRTLEQHGLTATGRVLGTTDYVAPEQAMGRGLDPRSDIYSLGVVLYEMLTGDVPFHADSQVGVAMKHVNDDLPDVQSRRPEVSATVALVVERATTKDPEARYQRIEEMLDDLETALEVEAARAGTTTGEATSVLDTVPLPKRKLAGRVRISPLAVVLPVLVAAIALTLVYGISSGWFDSGGGPGTAPAPVKPGSMRVTVESPTDFDPDGTSGEHPDEVGLATDGDPTGSAWTTENYKTDTYSKPGVGLYVEAQKPVAATELDLQTANPGWGLEIYAADEPAETLDGWTLVSDPVKSVSAKQAVSLDTEGHEYRYYLVWSTSPAETDSGYGASISDIRLFD